jgi:hypothetical protein
VAMCPRSARNQPSLQVVPRDTRIGVHWRKRTIDENPMGPKVLDNILDGTTGLGRNRLKPTPESGDQLVRRDDRFRAARKQGDD